MIQTQPLGPAFLPLLLDEGAFACSWENCIFYAFSLSLLPPLGHVSLGNCFPCSDLGSTGLSDSVSYLPDSGRWLTVLAKIGI
ncbi:hypothetical protein LZ32DRAFT_611553 [Colletotrichum eremochloae]|nr:hypothetical protein LZ32DRAFT_611553 [Colletotrichum eremochloae]